MDGLWTGFAVVAASQAAAIAYYAFMRYVVKPPKITERHPPDRALTDELVTHATAPGSFLTVLGYLAAAWHLGLLPDSYYPLTRWINMS